MILLGEYQNTLVVVLLPVKYRHTRDSPAAPSTISCWKRIRMSVARMNIQTVATAKIPVTNFRTPSLPALQNPDTLYD